MSHSPRIHISESLEVLLEESETTIDDGDDDDDDDRPRMRFYKSNKVLGSLYRAIDEQQFLNSIQKAANTGTQSTSALKKVWNYVEQETLGFQWNHLLDIYKDIKEMYVKTLVRFSGIPTYSNLFFSRISYEDNLRDLMRQYSATPWKSSITEFEVFVGTILGHGHKQSRRDKESSKNMRDGI